MASNLKLRAVAAATRAGDRSLALCTFLERRFAGYTKLYWMILNGVLK